MFDLIDGLDTDVWVFAEDRWYSSTDQGEHVEHERVASNQAPIVTTDFAALLDGADKITFVSDAPATLAELHRRIDERFAGRATVAQSQTYYLDITARSPPTRATASPRSPRRRACRWRTWSRSATRPTTCRCWRAPVCRSRWATRPAAVQAAAMQVTASNDADGVARAIDRYLIPTPESVS